MQFLRVQNRRSNFTTLALCLILTARTLAEHPLLPGYADYTAFAERVRRLDSHAAATVETIGATAEGRELFAIKLASVGLEVRPAILIVGGIDSQHPAGSELAIRLAETLANDAELLNSVTIYLLPRVNPDGLEHAMEAPRRMRLGNGIRTDDDRDGQIGEDPPEDLNGDGWISMMRVYRTGGSHRVDDEDPRLNATAEPAKKKPGQFDLYVEGVDSDHDELWNEDAADGVEFNRNFAFKYPAFERGAGPNAVSEIETRAVADFCFDHPEIQLVLCLGPQDNLIAPWKPAPGPAGRVPTSIAEADTEYFAQLAQLFRDSTKITEATAGGNDAGRFLPWVYYDFGRWALGTPGFSPAKPAPEPEANDGAEGEAKKAAEGKDGAPNGTPDTSTSGPPSESASSPDAPAATEGTPPPSAGPGAGREIPEAMRRRFGGRRGGPGGPPGRGPGGSQEGAPAIDGSDAIRDRQSLKWMDQTKLDGFVPWKEIVHPDFPNHKVEVGGFKPLWRENPPSTDFDSLTTSHATYVKEVAKLVPHLEIAPPTITPLGNNLFRIEIEMANTGFLPTSTEFGASGSLTYPVQIELKLPESVQLLHNTPRSRERRIAGGESVQRTWVVQAKTESPEPPIIVVRIGCVMTGYVQREFPLTMPAAPPPATP